MPTLEWSDALAMDLPQMDTTHLEFVALLAVAEGASDDALIPAWQRLVEPPQNTLRKKTAGWPTPGSRPTTATRRSTR
jgi:hypothetical protein